VIKIGILPNYMLKLKSLIDGNFFPSWFQKPIKIYYYENLYDTMGRPQAILIQPITLEYESSLLARSVC